MAVKRGRGGECLASYESMMLFYCAAIVLASTNPVFDCTLVPPPFPSPQSLNMAGNSLRHMPANVARDAPDLATLNIARNAFVDLSSVVKVGCRFAICRGFFPVCRGNLGLGKIGGGRHALRSIPAVGGI